MAKGQVFAVAMVRDEHDIIADTLAHMASEGVDHIMVADNLSADGTSQILWEAQQSLGIPVTVSEDADPGYRQSAKISRMAEEAFGMGAEWVVPFDADEIWWAGATTVGELLRAMSPDVSVAEASLYNHIGTDIDPVEDCAPRRIVHRQPNPASLPKVALRWAPGSIVWQGAHGVTPSRAGLIVPGSTSGLSISHFPWRSEEQFVTKSVNGAAAYAAAPELPADMGGHWRAYGELYDRAGRQGLADHYHRWFHFPRPEDADPPLVRAPAPFLAHR